MEVGAVAAMRYVKDGVKAARLVMQYTKHTLLVGEKASEFAISMGLPGPTNLSSTESINKWAKWKDNKCQPNFRKNVLPINNCGPFRPANSMEFHEEICSNAAQMQTINSLLPHVGLHSHDTISMAAIDKVRLSFLFFNFYLQNSFNVSNPLMWCRWDTLLLVHQPMGQPLRFLEGEFVLLMPISE